MEEPSISLEILQTRKEPWLFEVGWLGHTAACSEGNRRAAATGAAVAAPCRQLGLPSTPRQATD